MLSIGSGNNVKTADYFALVRYHYLDFVKFSLPFSVYVIVINNGDLEDPANCPVVCFYDCGTRTYLINDNRYSECDINYRLVCDKLSVASAELVKDIVHYGSGTQHTDGSIVRCVYYRGERRNGSESI